ncbi:hypothetical protein EsDP_00003052 [Epichloe bromicola]|uniref:Uncharacterized protein n=1 Tax=Epichloe bromicola TaxID=79588 RepID=A0ABQ0CMN9_9HYPO
MMTRLSIRTRYFSCAGSRPSTERCISYNRTALTRDALRTQVEAGLDDGQDGHKIRVDTEGKEIVTAAGNLPISPLFDVDWMKARRRQRKSDAGKPSGRFRRKLANNPYAQALATPIRRCPNTNTSLPRYFLQDFELVKHPSEDTLWWAPGPLAFEGLQPENPSSVSSSRTSTGSPPRKTSPITVYTLSRKSVLDKIGGPNKKYAALLSAVRTGMAVGPSVRTAVWRHDMGDALLNMMRRHATDALIAKSTGEGHQTDPDIQPSRWEEVGHVKLRGCALWLPGKDEPSTHIATMNVDNAKYGQTIAVHKLNWLLGEPEVQRLKSESRMFRDHNVLVLRQEKNTPTMRLHLLLWRLQGYLAQSSIS